MISAGRDGRSTHADWLRWAERLLIDDFIAFPCVGNDGSLGTFVLDYHLLNYYFT